MKERRMRLPAFSIATVAAATLALCPAVALAAEKPSTAYTGAAVTVVKASKACFADTISVSGMLVPREEVSVRPEREGLQISQVLVDAGETVTSGQMLARLRRRTARQIRRPSTSRAGSPASS